MDTEKQEFYEEIVECLIKYGNLSKDDAQLKLINSNIFKNDMELEMLFHETPYYWAMWILYSEEKPEWHHDPTLWPPPKDYLDNWFKKE